MPTVQKFLYRRTWLEARQSWVGASDTAALLGVGYSGKGPASVYASKIERITETQDEVSEKFELALAHESGTLEVASRRLGLEINHNRYGKEGTSVWKHDGHEFLAATPDGIIYDDGYNLPVESKEVGRWNSEEWEDGESPLMFQVQMQHQMACMNAPKGLLVGCIDGERLEHRWMERDDDFISRMVGVCGDFWDNVKTKTPPPADASDACTNALKQLYPDGESFAVNLPEAVDLWISKREEAHEAEKTAGGRKKALDNRLRSYLKQAMFGITPRGACVKLGEVKVKAKTCPHCERELKAPYKYRKLSWPKKLPQGLDLRTAGPVELAQDLELEEWLAQD